MNLKFGSWFIGFVRGQLVPGLVAIISMFALRWLGVELDSASLLIILIPIVEGAYYLVARWLEERFPALAWLGLTTQPDYENGNGNGNGNPA